MNRSVIYECPTSYFDPWLNLLHKRLSELHYLKRFNIPVNADEIAMIEVESCAILDSELDKFHQRKIDDEISKKEKNNGHGKHSKNRLPHQGRR